MTVPSRSLRRRLAAAAALLVAGSLALTGCGGDSGAGADGKVQLRFGWWGNDTRNKLTEEAIAAYEKANPDVDIVGEPGEWGSYWDKLATQTAARDAPDIIQMDEKYIREYGDRGALADLNEVGVSTDTFAPGTAEHGLIDGKRYGVNAGVNAPVILANPKVFKAAGLDLPDDTTWSWDDFGSLAAQLTEKTDSGTYGVNNPNDATLSAWLRQRGKNLFTADGLGFDAADLTEYLTWEQKLLQDKAIPPASFSSEENGKTLSEQAFARGEAGMVMVWSNQVNAFEAALGEKVELLRYPAVESGKPELWYKPSMFLSVSGQSRNSEAAGKFVDWWINSEEAGKILRAERGLPPNLEVREAITPSLDDADQSAAAFLSDIESVVGDTPPPPVVGAGTYADVISRQAEEMLFGRTQPAAAAQAAVDEINQNIKSQ